MGNSESSSKNDEITAEYIEKQKEIIMAQQAQIDRLAALQSNRVQPSQNTLFEEMKQVPQQTFKPISQEKNKFDPYRILNVGRQHSEEELKKAYLKLAIKTHPDRGGSEKAFQVVSLAYNVLLKKLKDSKNNNDHQTLRQNSQISMESQEKINIHQMDMALFNKVYEENKVEEAFDEGYGGWMKENKAEETDQKKLFEGKFNKDMFHNEFNKYKKSKKSNEIQQYEPNTSISYKGKDSLMVLGQNKVKDFSGVSDGGLAYRDYKDAFTNSCFIDVNSVDIKGRPSTIDDQVAQRSNVQYTMSDQDQHRYQQQKRQEEEEEKKRIERLQIFEEKSGEAYNKIHMRLLGK